MAGLLGLAAVNQREVHCIIGAEETCSHKKALRCSLFLMCWICFSYVHQDISQGNHASRLALLHAIVGEGRLSIDSFEAKTDAKAHVGGHFYSDKPPGVALIATPAFAAAIRVTSSKSVPFEPRRELVISWLTTALSVGLLTSLGAVFAFEWLCSWVTPKSALLTVIFVFFGGLPFPYATSLHSHSVSISLIFISLFCLGVTPVSQPRRPSKLELAIGGFACGLALASEYSCGIVILVVILLGLRSWFPFFLFGLGFLVPTSVVLAYNYDCFGDALIFGYSQTSFYVQMRSGFYGINHLPSPSNALALIIGSRTGLLSWSPFLFLAVMAGPQKSGMTSRVYWLMIFAIGAHVLAISAYWQPFGGSGLGPRFLAPLIPFLTLLAALGLQQRPWPAIILGAASVFLTAGATLANAYIPPDIEHPISEFYLPLIRAHRIDLNLGQLLGLDAGPSLVLWFVILSGTSLFLLALCRRASAIRPTPPTSAARDLE